MITDDSESETSSGFNVRFKDYLLENVYLRTTEAQRSEILELWRKEESGLTGADAERSSKEAVFLVRNRAGELSGVSHVALVRLKDGRRYYSYSVFQRSRDRVPYLAWAMCKATRDFLRNFRHPVAQPVGILHVTENPKLMRPGVRRLFARNGYKYRGQTSLGEDVWVAEFDEPDQRASSPKTPTNGE